MTCKDLHWYFEDHLRDAEVRSARGAVLEHISTCADCSRFVAQQRELGKNLRWVRESAPVVPQSVDRSVLLNYRRYLAAERQRFAMPTIYRFPIASRWTWSAISVVALLVISVWVLSARKTALSTPAETMGQPTMVASTQVGAQNSPPAAVKPARHSHALLRASRSYADRHLASAPVRPARSLPDGFRSLMYCDALSCPDAMDLIRVRVPTTAMPGQISGFIDPSGSVTADVLVGADGIARGIRFEVEEMEF
jgi:hypothetical protein